MRFLNPFSKYFILTVALSFMSLPIYSLSFTQSVKKAALNKNVWIPSASALLFAITGQDGEISDWASKNKPIFGNIKNAKNYSDAVAFYYLPAANLISKGVSHYQNKHNPNLLVHYTSFLLAPAVTYLMNRVIKDRTGRIRPDSSNDLSFPSAHTSLSSSLNEEFNYHSRILYEGDSYNGIYYFNEALVGSVAWARMEAKKHHLTDVLVGYSLGKFFSHFFHYYLFNKDDQVKLSFDYRPGGFSSGKFSWRF